MFLVQGEHLAFSAVQIKDTILRTSCLYRLFDYDDRLFVRCIISTVCSDYIFLVDTFLLYCFILSHKGALEYQQVLIVDTKMLHGRAMTHENDKKLTPTIFTNPIIK